MTMLILTGDVNLMNVTEGRCRSAASPTSLAAPT